MATVVNPNSAVPMYKQVFTIISDWIASGELKPGDRIPSEAELIEEFGVSRITVRSAIAELVEDGVLTRSQGKGTFVAAPKSVYKANDLVGFSRSCILAGKTPSTKLISIEYVLPMAKQSEFFRIPDTENIICTKRLRSVDGVPTMFEVNYYPAKFSFLFEENLEGSLFEIFQKHNLEIVNKVRTLETCFPTKEECELLNLSKNTPLLLFKDTQADPADNPLFLSKQLYNTEYLKFYF